MTVSNPHREALSELERLAKAATPKRWKPFWGDAVQAVMCARTDKEVVFWSGFDSSRTATTKAKRIALMNFIAAADPATVLSLIRQRDALLEAALMVQRGLNARIDGSDRSAVPVFDGIADLHDAINLALRAQSETSPDKKEG